MAEKFVRIGSMENVHVYDDGDFSGGLETDDVIKSGTAPVAGEDVLRLDDVGTLVGSVKGPAASTDNAIARWDGVTGAQLNDSIPLIDDSGRITNAGQTAFLAFVSAEIANVTGDGTVYTVIFDDEEFDNGGDFDPTTGLFTAPVNGIYQFNSIVTIKGITSNHVDAYMRIFAGAEWYGGTELHPYTCVRANGRLSFSASTLVKLTAAQTAEVRIYVNATDKTIDVIGSATHKYSVFSGFLVC